MSMIRKGRVRWVAKGDVVAESTVHRQALSYRCLTSPSPSQLNCVGSKLRNETPKTHTIEQLGASRESAGVPAPHPEAAGLQRGGCIRG
jgi:hypothetical protein